MDKEYIEVCIKKIDTARNIVTVSILILFIISLIVECFVIKSDIQFFSALSVIILIFALCIFYQIKKTLFFDENNEQFGWLLKTAMGSTIAFIPISGYLFISIILVILLWTMVITSLICQHIVFED